MQLFLELKLSHQLADYSDFEFNWLPFDSTLLRVEVENTGSRTVPWRLPDKADWWRLVTDAVSSCVKFIRLHIYVCLGITVVTDVPTHFQHISHFKLNPDLRDKTLNISAKHKQLPRKWITKIPEP